MLIGKDTSEPHGNRRAVVVSKRGMCGRAAGLPVAGAPDSRFANRIRLAGFAAVLAIGSLALVLGEWGPSIGIAQEIEHAIAYCLVAVILSVTGIVRWPQILVIIALAAALELGQALVPGRDCSLTDSPQARPARFWASGYARAF